MANCKLQEKEMSVVIVGGNECMERRYIDLCSKYDCKTKVYTKHNCSMRNIGNPDLLVLFMNTMSHKMIHAVTSELKSPSTAVAKCSSSSVSALKSVLEAHIKG